jgi:Phage tail tube protein, GTA-gp10
MMMLSPNARVRLPAVEVTLGDEKFTLCLTPYGCAEIERKTDCGVFQLLSRLLKGNAHAGDCIAIIEQALYDSGLFRRQDDIMQKHVNGKPLAANVMPAAAILGAAVHGLNNDG